MKYSTKPCIIEAIQWTGLNQEEVVEFCGVAARFINDELFLDTLEGRMKATITDYLIRGLRGEYYPCKADVFTQKYKPLDE